MTIFTRPKIHLLETLSLQDDGMAVYDFPYLRAEDFQDESLEVYRSFTPAQNASNRNPRGLRWGVYVRDEITWLDRSTYRLSAKLNPEEQGRVREMDLIPLSFLRRLELERLFREVFAKWDFEESSYERAYELQLSAIRYAPTHGRTATSPPPFPHRDEVDGGVIVINKRNIVGGINRIFDNDERPRWEFDMEEGQGFLIRDAGHLHYVSDVQLPLGVEEGYRDILIVRFQPLGR